MKTQQTQNNEDDVIIVIITIISILISILISCFTPSPKKSLQLSGTNRLPKKRGSNNTKPTVTSKTHPKRPSLAPVMSTETSRVSSDVIGFQSMETKNLKVGTTSQPTKTSKNGRSTQSALRQTVTK